MAAEESLFHAYDPETKYHLSVIRDSLSHFSIFPPTPFSRRETLTECCIQAAYMVDNCIRAV